MLTRFVLALVAAGALLAFAGHVAAPAETSSEIAGPPCIDDLLEDNDTRDTARPLPTPGPVFSIPLSACPADDDWFSVPAIAGQELQIEVYFSHAEGDIDIQLFDPGGNHVADSLSVTDNEKITHVATASGTYTLLVWLIWDAGTWPGNDYFPYVYRQPSSGVWGDANCDGHATAIDAALVLQLAAGLVGWLPCAANADTDYNGLITSVDALLILQYDAGLFGI